MRDRESGKQACGAEPPRHLVGLIRDAVGMAQASLEGDQMPLPSPDDIRKSMLEIVAAQFQQLGKLEHTHVLQGIAELVPRHERTYDFHRMALTQWNDLFRTGYLGLGWNLDNPGATWFHVTDRGMRAFKNLARDPANPAGYKNLARLSRELAEFAGRGFK